MKFMRNWHTSFKMLFSMAISFFIILPMLHWITIPAMPWRMALEISGIACGAMSLLLVLVGFMIESDIKHKNQIAMLKKLES